jgi:hypothetical protein
MAGTIFLLVMPFVFMLALVAAVVIPMWLERRRV